MADESVQTSEKSGHRKSRLVPVVIVSLLMIGEGVGVYYLANLLSPDPAATAAAELDEAGKDDGTTSESASLAEVEVAQCRPSNKMSGKLISFQIRVSALIAQSELERAKTLISERSGRLRDRINFVVRSVELQHLNEPGLETLKRRLKKEFDRVFEDEALVREVLIPELLQSGGGV